MAFDQLTADELYSLEEYSQLREVFRKAVLEHQKNRRVTLGEHLLLCFEDRLTVQYQLQEVLRAARMFERTSIESEIVAYHPLIPTGCNFKATMLLQLPKKTNNRQSPDLSDIGECLWLQFEGYSRVYATTDGSRSTTQWLSFELTQDVCAAMQISKPDNRFSGLTVGVDHPHYCHKQPLPAAVFRSLVADLASSG